MLHLAYLDHRQGGAIYATASADALTGQIAAFCRLWWSEIRDFRDSEALGDDEVVQTYFERHGDEYLIRCRKR